MENTKIKMFAQRLADNQKTVRDKALKMLRKHFNVRKSGGACFDLDDMLNIWKGLFYSMYMSDKPLIQESLADDISMLIQSIHNNTDKQMFIKAAFQTFAREWNGIDIYRVDKMMMFVRRVFRQTVVYMRKQWWNAADCVTIITILEDTVICPSDNSNTKPLGLKMHLADIYLEEIAKMRKRHPDVKIIHLLLSPYIKVLALSTIKTYINRVMERVMKHLMRQSDLGIAENDDLLEDEGVDPDSVEDPEEEGEDLVEMDEDADILDPRAGAVDVLLPQIVPDYVMLADDLQKMGGLPQVKQQRRTMLYKLSGQFRDLVAGHYPLSANLDEGEFIDFDEEEDKALKRIQTYEKKLRNKYDIGKKRKRQNNVSVATSTLDKSKIDDDEMETKEESLIFPKKKKNKKRKSKKESVPDTGKTILDRNLKMAVESKFDYKALLPKIGMMKFEVSSINSNDVSKKRKLSNAVESPNVVLAKKRKSINDFTVTDILTEKTDPKCTNDESKLMKKLSLQPSLAESGANNGEVVLNFSDKKNEQLGLGKADKNSTSADPWTNPLKEGEIEYFIKSRKLIAKEKKNQKKKKSRISPKKKTVNKEGRRSLIFNMNENKEHPFNHYTTSIKNSPQIQFSAEKRPGVSILKPSPSPILIHKPLLKILKNSKALDKSGSPVFKAIKRHTFGQPVMSP